MRSRVCWAAVGFWSGPSYSLHHSPFMQVALRSKTTQHGPRRTPLRQCPPQKPRMQPTFRGAPPGRTELNSISLARRTRQRVRAAETRTSGSHWSITPCNGSLTSGLAPRRRSLQSSRPRSTTSASRPAARRLRRCTKRTWRRPGCMAESTKRTVTASSPRARFFRLEASSRLVRMTTASKH